MAWAYFCAVEFSRVCNWVLCCELVHCFARACTNSRGWHTSLPEWWRKKMFEWHTKKIFQMFSHVIKRKWLRHYWSKYWRAVPSSECSWSLSLIMLVTYGHNNAAVAGIKVLQGLNEIPGMYLSRYSCTRETLVNRRKRCEWGGGRARKGDSEKCKEARESVKKATLVLRFTGPCAVLRAHKVPLAWSWSARCTARIHTLTYTTVYEKL